MQKSAVRESARSNFLASPDGPSPAAVSQGSGTGACIAEVSGHLFVCRIGREKRPRLQHDARRFIFGAHFFVWVGARRLLLRLLEDARPNFWHSFA